MRPISSHLDRTNLVNKGFIIWLLVKFCLRDTAGSPERARWLHLARSGSQSHRAIWFILPAHGACHIIKVYNNLVQICQGLVYTSPGEIASLKNCFCQALLSCASVIQQQVITQLRPTKNSSSDSSIYNSNLPTVQESRTDWIFDAPYR